MGDDACRLAARDPPRLTPCSCLPPASGNKYALTRATRGSQTAKAKAKAAGGRAR
jgi:hypothetical protein